MKLIATTSMLAMLVGFAAADTLLTSANFYAGVSTSGELFSYQYYIGLLNIQNGVDSIAPGNPRESWGITNASAGLFAYADQSYYGTSGFVNQTLTGASSFSDTTWATVTQNFGFVADNVVEIATTVTNTGPGGDFYYRREDDYDVSPTEFNEITYSPGYGGAVDAESYYGFESPVAGSGFYDFVPNSGGTYGPGDLGAGIDIDLGYLASGASTTFDIYIGANEVGQGPASLYSEIYGLGAQDVIGSYSSDGGGFYGAENSIALGYGGTATPSPAAALPFILGLVARRRSKKA